MASRAQHVTIDCADPYALAQFWSEVLDASISDIDEPGDPEALIESEDGTPLLFVRVPEQKSVKNRVHLDVKPTDRTRDQEVERLLALGATVVADHRQPDGRGWVTMADPEDNEFCVERSVSESSDAAQ